MKNLLEKRKPWQDKIDELTNNFGELTHFLDRYYAKEALITQIDKAIQQVTDSAESVYKIVLKEGIALVSADYGHISQIKGDNNVIVAATLDSVVGKKFNKDTGLVGRARREGQTINVPDAQMEPGYELLHSDTHGEIVIPMYNPRGGKLLGILNFERRATRAFDDEEISYSELLAGQVALAIEQVKLWRTLGLIQNFNSMLLSGEKSVYLAYKEVLNNILDILDFEFGAIMLMDSTKTSLKVIADSIWVEDINQSLGPDNSISGYYVFKENGRTPLKINDLPNSKYNDLYWGKRIPKSELIVPLMQGDELLGVINIEDTRENAFTEFDVQTVSVIAERLAESISAGFKRKQRSMEAREKKGFVLTQMGFVALDHLHRIGNSVSSVQLSLNIFLNEANKQKSLLPSFLEKEGLDYIEELVSKLSTASSLLDSLAEEFNPDLIAEPLSIRIIDTIEEVLSKMMDKTKHKINLHYNQEDKEKLVSSLTLQFKDMFEAIVNNGLEAMASKDDGQITVTVQYKQYDPDNDEYDLSKAEIIIEDNGEGIAPENLDKIFKFRFTTKKKNRKGQGLGMWLVKSYLEHFGGEITIEPRLSEGTRVKLILPIIL